MKKVVLLIIAAGLLLSVGAQGELPRVFVTTDINYMSGDPDDIQSLAHMFMFLDHIELEGVAVDRPNAGGLAMVDSTIAAYALDYHNPRHRYAAHGFPPPDELSETFFSGDARVEALIKAAREEDERPLYVLAWGNMKTLRDALMEAPDIMEHIRIFSIGTNFKIDEGAECGEPNWNGPGRNDIYHDDRFKDIWWVESDWMYAAMFKGEEPYELLDVIAQYGKLGAWIKECVMPHDWAHYFRAGDTPSLLYLIDNADDDNPLEHGWAGKFCQPFPEERPDYYTGCNGDIEWNYADPCEHWDNRFKVQEYRINTALEKRDEMYDDYIKQMNKLYGQP